MGTETWKDDADRPARFGRKARAWLGRRIAATLEESKVAAACAALRAPRIPAAQIFPALVAWYLERPARYVGWQDADEFRGGGFSNGAWTIDWSTVNADLDVGMRAVAAAVGRAIDAERYTSLDAWLAADIAGELVYPGAAGGSERLPASAREQLQVAARLRSLSRPRQCSCGAHFAPQRKDQKHCPACCDARRTTPLAPPRAPKPCATCRELFTPRTRRIRRCSKCVAEERASREAAR